MLHAFYINSNYKLNISMDMIVEI